MLFTILSTAALGGLAGYGYLKSNSSPKNESEKIIKILNNSGLRIKDTSTKKTETIRILKAGLGVRIDSGITFDIKCFKASR